MRDWDWRLVSRTSAKNINPVSLMPDSLGYTGHVWQDTASPLYTRTYTSSAAPLSVVTAVETAHGTHLGTYSITSLNNTKIWEGYVIEWEAEWIPGSERYYVTVTLQSGSAAGE